MITDEHVKEWNEAAIKGTMNDNENPIFAFSMTDTLLLVKFLNGELDAPTLMKYELRNRGLDVTGKYVGFNQNQES